MTENIPIIDETVRRRFEADWLAGNRGEADPYLNSVAEDQYEATLLELVLIQMEFQWRDFDSGGPEPFPVETYLARYPRLRTPAIVRELVEEEYSLSGAKNDPEKARVFRSRFPDVTFDFTIDTTVERRPEAPTLPQLEIPGYRILREIARGGMGVVYQARQTGLGRDVALKMILNGNLASTEELARFRTEAEAVARLQHPNIVQIYEVGEQSGKPYIALEYVGGGTLAQKMDRSPQPIRTAARMVVLLARAIHHAHRSNILHRDLKPSNVLLVPSDRPEAIPLGNDPGNSKQYEPKITDFGLAKLMDHTLGPTATDAVLGTPGYMAPEQASGSLSLCGPPTDVYALGAILYEMLTGRPPFQAGTVFETLFMVMGSEPVPPSRLRPNIPRDLATICLKCLEKPSERRYPTAKALAEDLHRFLGGEPILARPISRWERGNRWVRKNRSLAITFVISAVLLTSVAGVGLWNVLKERNRFRKQRDIAETNLYHSLMSQATGHLDSRGPEWWWKATDNVVQASKIETPERNIDDLRDAYIRCIGTPYYSLRVLRTWKMQSEGPTQITISPDSSYAAVAASGGSLELFRVQDGTLLERLTFPNDATTGLVFHPSRPILYTSSSRGVLRTIDVTNEASSRNWNIPKAGPIRAIAVHPNGTQLLVGLGDGRVLGIPIDPNGLPMETTEEYPSLPNGIVSIAFSPDGTLFCASDAGKRLHGVDTTSHKVLWATTTVNPAQALRMSNSDEMTYVDRLGYGFAVYNAKANRNAAHFQFHENAVVQTFTIRRARLTVSTDGSMAIWGNDGGLSLAKWTTTRSEFGPIVDAAITEDQKRILAVYLDGSVRVWELYEPDERIITAGSTQSACFVGSSHVIFDGHLMFDVSDPANTRCTRQTSEHVGGIWAVASDSQGRWLARGGDSGVISVWSAELGKPVATLNAQSGLVWCLAVHPNDRWLAAGSAQINLWDIETKSRVGTLPGHGFFLTRSLSFHPRESILASAGDDRMIRLWNLKSHSQLGSYGPVDSALNAIAFDPTGRWLYAGSENGKVYIWDTERLRDQAALPKPDFEFQGHSSPIRAMAFSRSGLLATGAEQGMVHLWDSRDCFRRVVRLQSRSGQIRSLQFSRDEMFLACGYYVGHAVVWNIPGVRSKLREFDLDWTTR